MGIWVPLRTVPAGEILIPMGGLPPFFQAFSAVKPGIAGDVEPDWPVIYD